MSSSKPTASAIPENDEYEYFTYAEDILGRGKKKDRKSGEANDGEEDETNKDVYLFYDFRRGPDNFPEGLEVCVHANPKIQQLAQAHI